MQLHIYFLFRNYITCHTSAFDKVCMPQKVVVPHHKNGGNQLKHYFSLQKLDMCEAGQGKERLQWQDGVGNIQVGNIQKEENS